MTDRDSIDLINRGLSEIGKAGMVVRRTDVDLFELGLSSIDRLLLIAKVEAASGTKVDMRKLGVDERLTVAQLFNALERS